MILIDLKRIVKMDMVKGRWKIVKIQWIKRLGNQQHLSVKSFDRSKRRTESTENPPKGGTPLAYLAWRNLIEWWRVASLLLIDKGEFFYGDHNLHEWARK